ncbi:MAG TPA: adenosine deaminase [Gemmatimonadaceae bacterium]|nr:adenosine deaminase [Gemmatimonadaceae bacterium]
MIRRGESAARGPAAPGAAWLRALPKAELHCHLDGSVRPQTLLELGREYGVPMPAASAAALRACMVARDVQDLEEYLARFATTLSVMQHAAALERIAYELMVDAARDGVRYIEVRYCPALNTARGLSLEAAVEAPLRGIARAEREADITGRVLLCALRHHAPDVSLELARLAVAYRSRGVVGFDLAGPERGHAAAEHAAAFAFARKHDLPVTIHAGEGDGAASIRQALYDCGASRIGHGTRLLEDASLAREICDRRIPIEVCLTSNVQTHVAAAYSMHPMREFFDRGMVVVLNTDNRLMSGTTLTDEYVHAAHELGFTAGELAQVARNGFASAFLPRDERQAMLARADRDIAALVGVV